MKKFFATLYDVKTHDSGVCNRILSVESQRGVTIIEYALIGSLVSIAAVTALGLIGGVLDSMFQAVVAGFNP